MSKIEELLKNEKVEWKKLGDVFDTRVGYTPSKSNSEFWSNGVINWFTIEDLRQRGRILNFSNVKISEKAIKNQPFKKNSIILSIIGTIGEYALIKIDFVVNQQFMVFTLKEEFLDIIDMDYMTYYFSKISEFCKRNMRISNVPTIDTDRILKIPIPIPTLEIQEKIVKTLDKFTKYVSQLQTELQFRLKQYEYYRNMLLSENSLNEISVKLESQLIQGTHKIQFSKDEKTECVGIENYINWYKITDVCLRQRGIPITAEKMKELHKDNAPVRIFAGGNTFADISIDDIDEKNVINTPSVVVKSRGNIDFEFYDKEFSHKNEMWSYSSLDNNILNIKFMYYYLKNNVQYFRDNAISGKLPQISTGTTDNYKIPIPNIEIQNHIVTILDKFQDILSDTKGMLPKEIELRQKQYEFYREKLLTFDVDYGRERERERDYNL